LSRVALITGGGSGLGKSTCVRLAEDGFSVAVADVKLEAAVAVARELGGGGSHKGYAVDVRDERSTMTLFELAEAELGPITVLVTFAGVLIERDGRGIPISETTIDEWETTFAVNARGTFLSVREMLRRRHARPVADARIITISSLAGQMGGVRGSGPYGASKGAVLALTKMAAGEGGAFGVTANCVAPGMVDTPMLRKVLSQDTEPAAVQNFPLRRIGQPDEIAAVVSFLASKDSSFVTGATIDVNGGQLLR